MSDKYILEGKTPKLTNDLMVWAEWMQTGNCRVAIDIIENVRISTVFLGCDYQFDEGQPLLFETMIFGGEHNDYQERCSTWEEAEAMHATACALVRGKSSTGAA